MRAWTAIAGKEDPTSSTCGSARLPLAVARLASQQRRQLDADRGRPGHASSSTPLTPRSSSRSDQTANMLPDVMFGIVGGVLADTLRPAPIADGGSRQALVLATLHSLRLTIAVAWRFLSRL